MTWTYAPDTIIQALENAGFDVNHANEDMIGGGSITARLERADRSTLLVIDAGGRVRIDLTTRLSEREVPQAIGGINLRGVESTVRTRTLTGQLANPDDVIRLLAGLDAIPATDATQTRPTDPPPAPMDRGNALNRNAANWPKGSFEPDPLEGALARHLRIT